jgi:hypothetical protein
MSALEIESTFPKLRSAGYVITSLDEPHYNCIAWAAGDDTRWWEPVNVKGYYWPEGLAWNTYLDTWIELFRRQGYERTDAAIAEEGFEKIAIFGGDEEEGTHVAKQLPDGTWTSKLGKMEDIEHNELGPLEGEAYGQVRIYMKRKRV